MINSAILVVSLTIGQFDPVYVCPPVCVIAPTDYIYYELDGMVERTRFYEWIEYGERYPVERRVPIINGFVPDVSKRRLDTGGWRIIYDYSRRTRLSECSGFEYVKPKKPEQTKKVIAPTTAPEPHYEREREYESAKEPSDSLKSSRRKSPVLELKSPSQIN